MFDRLVAGLVFGCGYERIADRSCPVTPRRRCDEWIAGLFDRLRHSVPAADGRLTGVNFADVSVHGCITQRSLQRQIRRPKPGRSTKQGLKRSQPADGTGVPFIAMPDNTRELETDHTRPRGALAEAERRTISTREPRRDTPTPKFSSATRPC